MNNNDIEDSSLLKYTGFILLLAGMLVAASIVSEAYSFFIRPADNLLAQYLSTELSRTEFIRINDKTVVLGESGALAMSVFLLFLFLLLLAIISLVLIKAAIIILTRSYSSDISRLKLSVSELAAKLTRKSEQHS